VVSLFNHPIQDAFIEEGACVNLYHTAEGSSRHCTVVLLVGLNPRINSVAVYWCDTWPA
jgi:hypothetical protein